MNLPVASHGVSRGGITSGYAAGSGVFTLLASLGQNRNKFLFCSSLAKIKHKMLVSIIIVQYNNSQDTLGCLDSIRELSYPNFKVITIDNASTVDHLNNTRLYIESSQDNRLTFISSKQNLGYAGGNNLGIKKALKQGADYILILNPDTTIAKDALAKLIEVAESDTKLGIIGPAINEGDKVVCGGKIEWLKPELEHIKFQVLSSPPHRPAGKLQARYYVPGAAMLIKRQVIEKIGLLDELYFLYFEDADYCVRAHKAGYELKIVPDAMVNHTVSASTSQLGSALLLRYHFRNSHLFNWKNGPLHVKLALPFWSIFIIIKQLVKMIFMSSKREISKSILDGVLDFYKDTYGKINV